MCDTHPDRPATVRLQGETDSFGSEMVDLCDECAEKAKEEPAYIGTCEWCKGTDVALKPRRDYDEGMAGRVYYVCQACITKDVTRLEAEWVEHEGDDYDEWADWED